MHNFKFKTDQESEDYCLEIIQYMVDEFGITFEEANDRINDKWEGLDWVDDIDTAKYDIRYHELPKDWAYDIYYGHDSSWWNRDKSELTPLPYRRK